MTRPVKMPGGTTTTHLDLSTIARCENKNPYTGLPLTSDQLVVDKGLKGLISLFTLCNPEVVKQSALPLTTIQQLYAYAGTADIRTNNRRPSYCPHYDLYLHFGLDTAGAFHLSDKLLKDLQNPDRVFVDFIEDDASRAASWFVRVWREDVDILFSNGTIATAVSGAFDTIVAEVEKREKAS